MDVRVAQHSFERNESLARMQASHCFAGLDLSRRRYVDAANVSFVRLIRLRA